MKKIGICHFRIGQTDGVSLEIDKRKRRLEMMGYKVILIGGDKSLGADYIIPELEFDRAEIALIKRNAFGNLEDFQNGKELLDYIYEVSSSMLAQILEIQRKERLDYVFLHNIFSHGRNIAAAKAFYDVSLLMDIPFIAVDHDFYFSYGKLYATRLSEIQGFMDAYVPPRDKRIRHITINSIVKNELKLKYGLDAMVFPDTFDFDQTEWKIDNYNQGFLDELGIKETDIVILQATRIVERKAIELAVEMASRIKEKSEQLIGKTLYNGKRIDEESEVVLLLPGFIEPASQSYAERIKLLCEQRKVKAFFVNSRIASQRGFDSEGGKIYNLWDCYVFSDIVTYPSVWEGWGNQFIEAVFAKKPIVVFEYPVYKADIKAEGYKVVSLGDSHFVDDGLVNVDSRVMVEATDSALQWLISSDTSSKLIDNFEIGRKNHGNEVLQSLLSKILEG